MTKTRATLYLRVPPSLRARLIEASRDAGVSMNTYAEHALATYLDLLRYERTPISSNTEESTCTPE